MKKQFRYFLIGGSLAVGLIIYLIFRETSSPFYRRAAQIGLKEILDETRAYSHNFIVPNWLIYSLPDGLWMFSLVLFIMSLWDFKANDLTKLWLAVAILSGVLFEFFPLFFSGEMRFDWLDTIFIVLGASLALSLKIKSIKNEESY